MLIRLATGRPRRVLVAAGVVFVVAAVLGAPVTGILGSSSEDYQDPASQYERANAAIRAASKQQPFYNNIAVLLRASHLWRRLRPAGHPDAGEAARL